MAIFKFGSWASIPSASLSNEIVYLQPLKGNIPEVECADEITSLTMLAVLSHHYITEVAKTRVLRRKAHTFGAK